MSRLSDLRQNYGLSNRARPNVCLRFTNVQLGLCYGFKKLVGIIIVGLLTATPSSAQISQHLNQELPDSLRPRDRNNLNISEVKKILENAFYLKRWGKEEYDETDSLCKLFAPKFSSISGKAERQDFLFEVCRYLYRGAMVHRGNGSLRGEKGEYAYPLADISIKYINSYVSLYGSGSLYHPGQFSKVLVYKSVYYLWKESFNESINTLQQALHMAKQSADDNDIVFVYTTFAHVFERLDLPHQSLEYCDSANHVLKNIKIPTVRSRGSMAYIVRLRGIANFSIYSKTLDSKYALNVRSLHHASKNITDTRYNGRLLAYSYVLQAGVSYSQSDYKGALLYIDSSYHVFPNLKLIDGWELAIICKGLSLRRLGRIREGNKVLQQLNLDDIRRPMIEIVLQEFYKEEHSKGNYQLALIYHEKLLRFQQRKHLLDMKGKSIEMEQVYNVRKRDLQILRLREIQNRNQNIVLIAFILIALGVTILITRYRATLAKTRKFVKQVNEASEIEILHLEEAREEERRILGRELHDGLSSSIAGIRHQLELLIMDNKDIPISKELEGIYEQVTDAYENSRYTSHQWIKSAKVLREQAFAMQIQTLVDRALPDSHYVKEILVDDGVLGKVSIKCRINLIRIVQEALTNIVKHAKARKIIILIYEDMDMVVLNIKDDGKGFDGEKAKSSKAGVGLGIIKERTSEMNGYFEINAQNGGTELVVSFPIS